jgi:hypothetical protein
MPPTTPPRPSRHRADRESATGSTYGETASSTHAMHIIAISQISHAGPGRDYDDRTIAEGKSERGALRALKRQISNAVYCQLVRDAQR